MTIIIQNTGRKSSVRPYIGAGGTIPVQTLELLQNETGWFQTIYMRFSLEGGVESPRHYRITVLSSVVVSRSSPSPVFAAAACSLITPQTEA